MHLINHIGFTQCNNKTLLNKQKSKTFTKLFSNSFAIHIKKFFHRNYSTPFVITLQCCVAIINIKLSHNKKQQKEIKRGGK